MERFQISTVILVIDYTSNSLNNFARFLLRRNLEKKTKNLLVLQGVILIRGWALRIGKNCFMIAKKKKNDSTVRNSFKCLSLFKFSDVVLERTVLLALTTRWLWSLAHPARASRLQRIAPLSLGSDLLKALPPPGTETKQSFSVV